MRKKILTLALISFITLTSCKKETKTETENPIEEITENTSAGSYNVDSSMSNITWEGSKPTGKHTGTIAIKEGAFEVTEGKISGGSFVIDMTSITVTDLEGEDKTKLETHLKGTGDKQAEDHFFNTTKFPTSSFKISSITEANGAYMVNGMLTIKDIEKEISFPAEIVTTDADVSLISDSFTINRTNWGVNYASKSIFDDLKDSFVNDEISLVVKVKASK